MPEIHIAHQTGYQTNELQTITVQYQALLKIFRLQPVPCCYPVPAEYSRVLDLPEIRQPYALQSPPLSITMQAMLSLNSKDTKQKLDENKLL